MNPQTYINQMVLIFCCTKDSQIGFSASKEELLQPNLSFKGNSPNILKFMITAISQSFFKLRAIVLQPPHFPIFFGTRLCTLFSAHLGSEQTLATPTAQPPTTTQSNTLPSPPHNPNHFSSLFPSQSDVYTEKWQSLDSLPSTALLDRNVIFLLLANEIIKF